MKDFQNRFKSFDNRKLLRILEEAKKYQPEAVQAAKLELSKRELSESEIQSVKDEFADKVSKIEKRKEQVKKVEHKATVLGTEFLETVNPIQKEPQTIDRKINLMVIAFGLIAVYQIFTEFGLIKYSLTDGESWDASMYFYFIPIIMLPIGLPLFWKRFKLGWVILTAYFVYNIGIAIGSCFLFTCPDPFVIVVTILFFGAALWVLSREDVREAFRVENTAALITLGASMWLTIVLLAFI